MFLGEPQNIYLVLRVSPKGAGVVHWDPAVPAQGVEGRGNTRSVMRVIPHVTEEYGLINIPAISGNCVRHTARALVAKNVLSRVRDMGGPGTLEELAVRNIDLFQTLFNGGSLEEKKEKGRNNGGAAKAGAAAESAPEVNVDVAVEVENVENDPVTERLIFGSTADAAIESAPESDKKGKKGGKKKGQGNKKKDLSGLFHPDTAFAVLGGSCGSTMYQGALCFRPLYPLMEDTRDWDWDALEAGRAAGLIKRPLPSVPRSFDDVVALAGYVRGDESKRFRAGESNGDDGGKENGGEENGEKRKSSSLPYETQYIVPGTILVGTVVADSAVPLAAAYVARFAELLKKEPYIGAMRAIGYGLVDVLGCFAYDGTSASLVDSSLYDEAADAAARAVLKILAA